MLPFPVGLQKANVSDRNWFLILLTESGSLFDFDSLWEDGGGCRGRGGGVLDQLPSGLLRPSCLKRFTQEPTCDIKQKKEVGKFPHT